MRVQREYRSNVSGPLVMGGLLILVGFLFLLDTMGIAETGWVVARGWPVFPLAIGLSRLFGARTIEGRIAGAFWVLVGSLFMLSAWRILPFSVWGLIWPIMLMMVGLFMVLKSRSRNAVPVDTDSKVSATAILGGVSRKFSSQTFEGGELTSVMGGCEIDLREAVIAGDEAVIDVFVTMGGIELQVPKNWRVVSDLVPIMAGLDDKTTPTPEPAKRLVIKGILVMGGVEVKN